MNETDRRLQCIAEKAGVLPAAILFVQQCFPADDSYGVIPPISVEQLCWRIHDIALRNYHGKAREQLEQWGIDSTETIGKIVIGLADQGFLRKSCDEDLSGMLDHYRDIFDFSDAFVKPHFDPPAPINRWTIGGILAVTTAVSIALPGYKSLGFAGGIGTLLGIWIAIIGAACILMTIRSEMRGKSFALSLGIIFLAIGITVYILIASKPAL